MKIAISLFGLVGNIVGKSGTSTVGADKVLDLSYKHWYDYVISKNDKIDFFVHSWSEDQQDNINKLFNPVASKYEPQKIFDIPDYVVGTEIRKQSHYSRFYSTKQSIMLKQEYEAKHNFKYDWVMSARFDIAWKKPIEFNLHNNKWFYYGGMDRRGSIKVIDFWFFSNSEYMDKFCYLYDDLDKYTLPKGSPRRISSHSLCSRKMDELDCKTKSILRYEHFTDPTKTDYPLIRYEYFGAQN